METQYRKVRRPVMRPGYLHSDKEPDQNPDMRFFTWVPNTQYRVKPRVYFPQHIWGELTHLAKYSTGEFTALLKMTEINEYTWKVEEWYIPYQDTTDQSINLAANGPLNIVKDLKDTMEHFYGCYHVHPGIHGVIPQMSMIDINTMWQWVKAAGRGVFVVAHRSGEVNAVLLEEKDGIRGQLPMEVEILHFVTEDRQKEMEKIMDERVAYGEMGEVVIDGKGNIVGLTDPKSNTYSSVL